MPVFTLPLPARQLQRFRSTAVASLSLMLACSDGPSLAPPDGTPVDSSLRSFNNVQPVPMLAADDAMLGGATTVFDASSEAYEQPSANLAASDLALHDLGDEEFTGEFDKARGLGPHFNNVSCESCHAADGRGSLPSPGEALKTAP